MKPKNMKRLIKQSLRKGQNGKDDIVEALLEELYIEVSSSIY
jgi:hypothetical protein